MKVNITIAGAEATIEIIPETTSDRDALNLAVNTSTEAKCKKNGTVRFIMQVPQVAIGRASAVKLLIPYLANNLITVITVASSQRAALRQLLEAYKMGAKWEEVADVFGLDNLQIAVVARSKSNVVIIYINKNYAETTPFSDPIVTRSEVYSWDAILTMMGEYRPTQLDPDGLVRASQLCPNVGLSNVGISIKSAERQITLEGD